ncbi:FG-GAP-like repeat-containing protein [Roseiconus lacunae]|uniref:FG-GAP-like repeat-containing protein n=1 Tax=Roseiconus lacunae TaxID=2605694 RepID=UPI00308C3D71|nr:FG-GAP-like repeat-containing protein [Stieleria sp. HD01]
MRLALRCISYFAVLLPIALGGCGRDSQDNFASSPAPNAATQANVATQTDAAPIKSAEQAFERGDLEAAEQAVRQLMLRQPDHQQARQLLVRINVRQSKFKEAAEILLTMAADEATKNELSDNDSNEIAFRMQAAELLFSTEPLEAIETLADAVKRAPDHLVARRLYAGMLNEQGFRFDANEQLRYLAARSILTLRELIALVNPMLTWVQFSEKPNIDDPQTVKQNGVLNVVAALRANGDVREARLVLERSELLTKRRHPAAVAMQGYLLVLNQDFDALRQWASEPSQSLRRYPAYWLAIGSLLEQQNDPSSVGCFYEALRREPGSMEAATALTQALTTQQKQTNADQLRDYQKSINESQALAYKMGSGGPPNPYLAREMGRVMKTLGRPVEAIAWQETVIQATAPTARQLAVLAKHKQQLLRHPNHWSLPPLETIAATVDLKLLERRLRELTRQSDPAETRVSRNPTSHPIPLRPRFVDIAKRSGITMRHFNRPERIEKEFRLFEALGSGVAALDYDLDGKVDLYLGQAGSDPPHGVSLHSNSLYRNLYDQTVDGNQSFIEVSKTAHCEDNQYTHGVTAGDWNQDGMIDLVVGNVGTNRILVNQGDGTFREIDDARLPENWNQASVTMAIGIADLTGDGLPDLCEVEYVDDPSVFNEIQYHPSGEPIKLPGPKHFRPANAKVCVHQSDGTVKRQTLGRPEADASTGLGLLITDLDGDRTNEVFVANDQNPNHLWKLNSSDQNPTWSEIAVQRGVAFGTGGKPMACMGVAAADFDGNGHVDLHITNFNGECSNLYLQQDNELFVDQAIAFGLDQATVPMVGFGTQAFDYDHNGSLDLVIANGHIEDLRQKGKPFRMPTQILARRDNHFHPIDVEGSDDYFQAEHLGRCVVTLDHNQDGRLDLAITDLVDDFVLLENQTESTGQAIMLELIGTKSERDAIGTRIELTAGRKRHVAWAQTGDGYLGKNEAVIHIGIHQADVIDKLVVDWPSGQRQVFTNIAPSRRMLVIENQSELWPR